MASLVKNSKRVMMASRMNVVAAMRLALRRVWERPVAIAWSVQSLRIVTTASPTRAGRAMEPAQDPAAVPPVATALRALNSKHAMTGIEMLVVVATPNAQVQVAILLAAMG